MVQHILLDVVKTIVLRYSIYSVLLADNDHILGIDVWIVRVWERARKHTGLTNMKNIVIWKILM